MANRALELIGKHLGMFTERPAGSLIEDNRQVFNIVIATPEGKEMPLEEWVGSFRPPELLEGDGDRALPTGEHGS